MADNNMSPEEIQALMATMGDGENAGGGEPPETLETETAGGVVGGGNDGSGSTANAGAGSNDNGDEPLSPMDLDILGEVYNVSMGAAASTVSSLLRMKVDITTPQLTILKEADLSYKSLEPAVGVEINYVVGVQGINVFILSQLDVMKIVDIWMGGTGQVDESSEFNEMHMSAIGEVMNQMMGQSSMALAGFLNTVIDISAPDIYKIEGDYSLAKREPDTEIVATKFKFLVGDNVIDSELITTCDIGFAKGMINMAKVSFGMSDGSNSSIQNLVEKTAHSDDEPVPQQQPAAAAPAPQPQVQPPPQQPQQPVAAAPPPEPVPVPVAPTQQQINSNQFQQPPQGYYPPQPAMPPPQQAYAQPQNIQNVQPVSFGSFDLQTDLSGGYMGNINLIRRVPLDITAEIGQTRMPVREVLEFGEGSIIPFERQSSEPIDIFANGVLIAKGLVVVIEDNFGVRITEILSPDELIRVAGIN
jgi:flagellar motor switch protein FliN/FliY